MGIVVETKPVQARLLKSPDNLVTVHLLRYYLRYLNMCPKYLVRSLFRLFAHPHSPPFTTNSKMDCTATSYPPDCSNRLPHTHTHTHTHAHHPYSPHPFRFIPCRHLYVSAYQKWRTNRWDPVAEKKLTTAVYRPAVCSSLPPPLF